LICLALSLSPMNFTGCHLSDDDHQVTTRRVVRPEKCLGKIAWLKIATKTPHERSTLSVCNKIYAILGTRPAVLVLIEILGALVPALELLLLVAGPAAETTRLGE